MQSVIDNSSAIEDPEKLVQFLLVDENGDGLAAMEKLKDVLSKAIAGMNANNWKCDLLFHIKERNFNFASVIQ